MLASNWKFGNKLASGESNDVFAITDIASLKSSYNSIIHIVSKASTTVTLHPLNLQLTLRKGLEIE